MRLDKVRAADDALQRALENWRRVLVKGSDLSNTSLNKRYNNNVYKHFQYVAGALPEGVAEDGRIKPLEAEGGKWVDDFQSPMEPEAYVQLRLIKAQRFYQKRLPQYSRKRMFFTTMAMICTSCSSLLAYADQPVSVALLSSLAAAILAWAAFLDVGRKIERYSTCINMLKALISWWDSLRPVERASTQNVTKLVLGGENIISSEHLAWKSTGEDDATENKGGDAEGGSSRVETPKSPKASKS